MLVGNKCDLNDKRVISAEEGTEFAMQNGLAFIETSALSAINVDLAFETIIFRKYFSFLLTTDFRNLQANEEERHYDIKFSIGKRITKWRSRSVVKYSA